MANELLQIAVAQTVDVLTFSQSHEVDLNFRVHSKATADALRSLQAEQRNRIDQAYGPRPLSPDFLSTQLLACYRGEAASIQLAKASVNPEKTATAITAMSDAQCRAFKKEMKQRIHEWEASVRDMTGQTTVRTEQKAQLRWIYELYKASKTKVEAQRDSSIRSSTADLLPHGRQTEVSQSVIRPAPRTGSTTLPNPPTAVPVAAPSPGSLQTTSPGEWPQPREISTPIPRVTLGTMATDLLTDSELQTEKRSIKMVLFKFETEFSNAYGEPPNRRDRRGFAAEYNRYAALKGELSRRTNMSGAAATSGPNTPR